jgi:hypothetical protein
LALFLLFKSGIKSLRYSMPETFLGDLAQVKLFDILSPLSGSKKTGKILVRGKDGGELYLELGTITHAKTNNAVGDYAFFTLIGLKAGKASFEPDVVTLDRTVSISTEQLLSDWSLQKEEWDKLRDVIPSLNTIFHLSLQKNPENRNVDGEQWNILALCNGTKTVSEIAQILNLDAFKTSRAIFQLVQLGLLERGEDRKPIKKKIVSENFFIILEAELKKLIGPMAAFIIDDKLSHLGETRDSLAQNEALSFVEALSEDISQDVKKKEFLRVMTEFLLSGKR